MALVNNNNNTQTKKRPLSKRKRKRRKKSKKNDKSVESKSNVMSSAATITSNSTNSPHLSSPVIILSDIEDEVMGPDGSMIDEEETKENSSVDSSLDSESNASEDKNNKSKCMICQEIYDLGDNIKTLPCFHFFHNKCINQWSVCVDSLCLCVCG